MAGAEWLNRYVSIEKEVNGFGQEPSGTQIFGEVDDESFKQTFDLLTRSDMSRQVASKAVTNTKYGEGSINFAVQPDDFMGNILKAFLPASAENEFWDDVSVGTDGFGYATGQGSLVTAAINGRVYKAGYWEVINAQQDALALEFAASATVLRLDASTTGWATYAGLTVGQVYDGITHLGYGVVGKPGGGANATTGFYFSYSGIGNNSDAANRTLTGVVEYNAYTAPTNTTPASFASHLTFGTIPVDTPVVQFRNHVDGIIPGQPYFYITEPMARVLTSSVATSELGKNAIEMTSSVYALTTTALTPESGIAKQDLSDYKPTGTYGITGTATTNSTEAATIAAVLGGPNKHVFQEPVSAADVYPSYTLRVGREAKEHTFTGMVATRLSLSANLNEYVMASCDWLGQAEKAPDDIQTGVSFSGNDVDALHFSGAELYVDGSLSTSTKIQSISLEININRDIDSAYAVGSNTIQRIPPSRTREITGTMEFNEITYADTTGMKGEPTYKELAIEDEVHKLHGGAGRPALILKFQDALDADNMEITLFNVRFEAPEASVSGRDPARMTVGFQAFYDSKLTGANKAIVVKMKGSNLSLTGY